MDSVFEKVINIITDVLKIDGSKITPETRFIEDLKADSMDQFLLMDRFSEDFNVTISDEEAASIKTVGDIVKLLTK